MSISTRLRDLSGARALLVCYVSGALLSLIFAPTYYWPLLFVCLPVFFLVLDSAKTKKAAAARSFAFGFGHFMVGTWWIANALTVDMAKFGWLIPFSVGGISAALALYTALFGYLYHRLKSASLAHNIVRFVALWVAIEFLRSVGIFGFPWNLMGYAALASLEFAQLASVLGVFGLSFVVLHLGLWPLLMWEQANKRARIAGIAIPLLFIAAAYGLGAQRVSAPAEKSETTVRIVQPSIAQEIKASRDWEAEATRVLGDLMDTTPVDFTVWPETAYPTAVRGNRVTVPPFTGALLTGALRIEGNGREHVNFYNSIVAVDPTGLLLMAYDKHQLVPFGEFVPLRSVLPLEKITPGNFDFTRGQGPQTILLRDQPSFSPLVCYEVIFPWMAVDSENRPEWIVNVTNDGWYGDTAGPYQHLAAAQMRAIEQGIPVVRAANTGVSALIDPQGRVIERIAYNARGVIITTLPKPMPPTIYSRLHVWPICLLLLLVLGATLQATEIKKNK